MNLFDFLPDTLLGFHVGSTDVALGIVAGLVAAALTATYTGLQPWKGALIALVAGTASLVVCPLLLDALAGMRDSDSTALSWIGSAAVAGLVASLVGSKLQASVPEAMTVTCMSAVSTWTLLNFVSIG